MTMRHDAATRARALVGTRFRAQGRDPRHGLDCLGLVIAAHRLPQREMPADYRLRGEHRDALLAGADRWFRRVAATARRAGDVLLLDAGPGQSHLAVVTDAGVVHADARIGRVVETPGASAWPVTAVLRRRSRAKRRAG
jgi:lipoprotein Spr